MMVFVALSVVASAQTVSLNIQNRPLSEALQAITKATNYEFVYSDILDVKALTTIECNNENLKSVLDKIFTDKGIAYKIDGKVIALSPSAVAPKKESTDKKHVVKVL
jgi:type II secretory pathway component HofQ